MTSAVETPTLATRPLRPDTADCSDPAVAAAVNEDLDDLPFLGRLTCTTTEVQAGTTTEIVLEYEVGASGIADSGGLKLCFKYYSDWDLQTDEPGGRDYASAEITARSTRGGVAQQDAGTARRLDVHYDVKGGERPYQKALLIHVVDGYLRPGDTIVIRLGDRRLGGPGTRVQTFVEDDFAFLLHVDVLGTSRMASAGEHRVDVVPGPPRSLVVRTPRVVRAGATFPVRAHLEDEWGNACRPFAVQAGVHGDVLAEAPQLRFASERWAAGRAIARAGDPGAGDITVEVTGPHRESWTATAAVEVVGQEDLRGLPSSRAYFADLHVHSDDTVGTQDTPWNLAYGREVGGLDVLGYTANDFQVTDEDWERTVADCRASADESFVCFPGVEWCGNAGAGGDHNVVYLGEDTRLARSLQWRLGMTSSAPEPEHWPITRLYESLQHSPDDYLLIPHVGGRRGMLHWHQPELERLIEVHSAWGTSPWFFEEALRRGLRLGVSAASDEHRGRPGSGAPGANIFGGRGGLTGVLAPELDQRAVAASLRRRRTWATTGARAVGLLTAGDAVMGDVVAVGDSYVLAVDVALFADGRWEHIALLDSEGVLTELDLHRDHGYADDLVRVRWGGARHRDRYRWATWEGAVHVAGAAILDTEPWARLDPESVLSVSGQDVTLRSRTYGADTGIVLRLDDLSSAEIDVDLHIREDASRHRLQVSGDELLAIGRQRVDCGGAGLHLTLERITDPSRLPVSLRTQFSVAPADGDSVVYVRARQWDGQQLWTSPLFLER